MTINSAQKLGDLLTLARNVGRRERGTQFVVFVEAADGSWCELDADSALHAVTLADNWVAKLDARGASCRIVNPKTGRILAGKPFHMVFHDPFEDD